MVNSAVMAVYGCMLLAGDQSPWQEKFFCLQLDPEKRKTHSSRSGGTPALIKVILTRRVRKPMPDRWISRLKWAG